MFTCKWGFLEHFQITIQQENSILFAWIKYMLKEGEHINLHFEFPLTVDIHYMRILVYMWKVNICQ